MVWMSCRLNAAVPARRPCEFTLRSCGQCLLGMLLRLSVFMPIGSCDSAIGLGASPSSPKQELFELATCKPATVAHKYEHPYIFPIEPF